MASLNFETAVRNHEGKHDDDTITLDGREMAVRKPSPARIAIGMRAVRNQDLPAILEFFLRLFPSDEDKEHILDRLDDDDDAFDLVDEEDPEGSVSVATMLKAMMERWSARPTSSPNASGRSASTTGKPSTGGAPRTKARRRSTSPSTAS